MSTKRICVIGAGPCGLTALKSCLEEGLQVDCYDKLNDIGGLWRYREEDFVGIPSVMKNTIIDTSKEMSAFSDFPPDPAAANFMHNKSLIKYFESYADHFKLRPHIHLQHEIITVKPDTEYDVTGQWEVTIKDKTAAIQKTIFDGVMVCVGHHTYPFIPQFPGLEKFKGKVIHSHSYKSHDGFEDKNILVVGVGNSGLDLAVELGRIGKQVYLSTRRGCWMISRVGKNGIPWDLLYSTRFLNFIFSRILPFSLTNSYFEHMVSQRMDHDLYGLKPAHRIFQQHATVGDDIPNGILAGRITVKKNVHHFDETGVVFEGEENKKYDLDCIVLATGYSMSLPFMDKSILEVNNNKTNLYEMVFPPHLKQPTLAIIGYIQPFGAIFPLAELQSRWAVRVFTGKQKLPTESEMIEEIEKRHEAIAKQFVNTQRHTIECNFVDYAGEIAAQIGAKPNSVHMALTDPRLFLACLFGPCVPYQFRLQGPHAWSGARKAVLDVPKRMKAPLNAKSKIGCGMVDQSTIGIIAAIFLALLLALILF